MKNYFTFSTDKLPVLLFAIIVILNFCASNSLAQSKTKQDEPKTQKKKAKLPAQDLSAMMLAEASYNFSPSALNGVSVTNPTSLQFGPDGRLYVSQQNGLIKVFTVVRNGSNNYQVTATETISLINGIPNYNDDGTPATSVTTRQVTGILLAGTAATPILYVSSSDSRIGGPSGDKNLDTNSGIISKLTKTASGWDKTDLVRGLPRSEENHANNGMQLDEQTNILYVAVGGFTNAGSPSNNFAFITEYALAAAILSIDLNVINALPTVGTGNNKYKYDLPTLDDPTRTNDASGKDPGDPFGGNDGLNQAKIVAGGPVQIYSPGYRNAYDLVITKTPGKARRMYTIDNGPNQGWGGHPANEGATGAVTNNYVSGEPGSNGPGPNDPQVNNLDNLHYIGNLDTYVRGSHYGGHPTPVRANPAGAGLYTHSGTGVWRTSKSGTNPLPADWPPLPLNQANPIEGDYQNPGETDRALLTFGASTNGLVEYRASNFNNALKGDLLAAGYNGVIFKISLNAEGNDVLNLKGAKKINQDIPFASGFGSQPLDVTAQGDNDIFPGTVWAATYGASAITVFEPQDFFTCSGTYSTTLDEDRDGYSNADEIDNATNPCSASSRPDDFDNDLISDLNDPDDDNDGLKDNVDYFALDASNGLTTQLPIRYDLFNNDPGKGLFGLGFTGLMSNGKADNDYYNLFDENNLIAGGAVGAFSVVAVSGGDALGTLNNQENGFQFGVNVNTATGPFTVQSRMLINFFDNKTPVNFQSQGMYIGTGDQDNYFKISLNANSGTPGIQIVYENGGVATSSQYALGGLPTQYLDFFLSVNPSTGTIQPKYAKNGGGTVNVGSPITVGGSLLNAIQNSPALAVGLISTSRGATPFTANWDLIYVLADPVAATGGWQAVTPSSGAPTARHEAAYVQAGDKFYLLGGRGIKPVQIYNPATKTWTNGASTPIELHHFQAVTLDGLIYVVGAHTGVYPGETPVPNIYIYNPLTNKWITGPQIPVGRRRGSAGTVVYNNKIYLVGGIINGHNSGHVTWVDEYDPYTNTWTVLPDAPRARDHFQAAVVGTKLYAAGGRRTSASTGQTFSLTVPEVDVYDFSTKIWSTLANNIPTQRAGTAVAVLGSELLVIGGESSQATAHNQTQALNVNTNTWRSLSNLLQGRHGTQAIVSNNGIYVAAGSASQGGSPELSTQEAFYMFSPTTPTGSTITASAISSAPANIAMGQVSVGSSKTEKITLTNTTGNQSIVITSLAIADNNYSLNSTGTLPLILGPGKSMQFNVVFTPSSGGIKSSNLIVMHSTGSGQTSIPVSGEGVAQLQSLYLINAGGPAITSNGRNWLADSYSTGGAVYTNNNIADITGTTDDVLYKTERSSPTQQFGYAFPVSASGTYTVKLHFAEIYFGATGGTTGGSGKRVFSVNLEGGTVELPNYDIFAEVGAMTAVVKTFNILVTDGILNIDFAATVNQPKISAIEIAPATATNLSVSPSSLHFFSQQAGTTSPPQTLTLRNTGTTSLNVTEVTITGANNTQFIHNFTAANSIAAGATATINVNFKPTSLGTKTAQLNITHTGSNPTVVIGLTGEGHDNPNQSPILFSQIPDQTATVGTAFNFSFASNTFTDADGDPLSYTATLLNGSALPSWLNFNSSTRTFSGTPASNNPALLTVKVTASDNKGGTATDDFIININAVTNQLPTVNAGADKTITLPANSVSFTATASDADGSIASYAWTQVSGPSTATLSGATTATLTASNLIQGAYVFRLTVKDNANASAFDEVAVTVNGSSTTACTASGTILREYWANVTTSTVPVNTTPTSTSQLNSFEAPSNVADNYGQRIMGYICAPVSGNYTFYVASDDDSELWLSTNATPATKRKIASVSGYTGSREWAKFPSQRSTVIALQAGLTYYIEALHKEGSGGDNLAVGWTTPTNATITVIPGSVLSPFVTATNQLPTATLTSPASGTSFVAPASINLTANASDADGTVSKVEFFNGNNKLGEDLTAPYSFTWSNVAAGTYSLTARATDNSGATANSAAISITVNPAANQLPTVNAGADKVITLPVNSVSFTATASDADGSIASYAWTQVSGPSTATLSGAASATLTASNLIQGAYVFRLTVTDNGGASAFDEVAVTVNGSSTTACSATGTILREYWANITGLSVASIPVNTTPTSTSQISSFETAINAADNYGQRIRGYVCAPVSGSYTFYISGDDDSELWLSTSDNPAARVKIASLVGWTNPKEWLKYGTQKSTLISLEAGKKYYIEALHKEGSGGDNLAVGWTTPTNATITVIPGSVLSPFVTATNQLPTATLTSPASGTSFVAPASINLTANASDADGTVSKVEFFNGNNKLGEDLTAPYSFTWSNVAAGTYSLTARATDNSGATANSAAISITVNPAANQLPTVNAGADKTITLPVNSVSFTATASDADGSIASYTWTQVSGPSTATLSGAASTTLTASNLIQGAYVFRLTVKDNANASAFDEVAVTVNAAANRAPVVSVPIPDQTATVKTAFRFVFAQNTFSDADADVLSYTASLADGSLLPSWLTFTASSRSFAGTPPRKSPASIAVKVTASDNRGGMVSDEFMIYIVSASNQLPTVNAGEDQTITPSTSEITLNAIASDADDSIASYTWSQVSGPSVASLADEATASLTASNLQLGSYVFNITVMDTDSATASDEVSVIVNPAANQVPMVDAGADQTIILPASSATLNAVASDSDGSITDYAWTHVSGPSTVSFNTGSSSTIVSNLIEGVYVFRITVTDDKEATAFDEVSVTVNSAANQVPTVDAGVDQSITLPTNTATFIATASDTDGSIASYSWTQVNGPSAVTLAGESTASLTASGLIQGSYVFRLTVTDNGGATAFDEVAVTVNAAANQAPVVALPIADQSATVGTAFSLVFAENTFSDPDADVLSYSASLVDDAALPSWLNFTSSSRSFTGTPTSNTPAAITVKVTASDNKGGMVSDEFVISINPAVPAGQVLTSFTLINADTEQEIRNLVNGDILNLSALPTRNLNIRANTNPALVGNVVFDLSGMVTRKQTETGAPYALFGDANGNYHPWTPVTGSYTLSGTPYSGASGGGTKGTGLIINFTVTNSTARLAAAEEDNHFVEQFDAYPNPFTYSTTVHFKPAHTGKYELAIYNPQGALVKVLYSNEVELGKLYAFELNAHGLRSGVYIARLSTKDAVLYQKIMLLK